MTDLFVTNIGKTAPFFVNSFSAIYQPPNNPKNQHPPLKLNLAVIKQGQSVNRYDKVKNISNVVKNSRNHKPMATQKHVFYFFDDAYIHYPHARTFFNNVTEFNCDGAVGSNGRSALSAALQTIRLRYTATNAETTAGGIGLPVGDSVELSGCNLAAFFAPKPLFGRARWGAARLARVASSRPTHLVPSTRLVSDGRFVKRTERRHAMAIKAKPQATPTHFFYPKFKKGDICRLKRCTAYPEINGLTVTLQSDLIATKNAHNLSEAYLGYEVDLVYMGNKFCIQEDQLTKIGEVEL